MPEADDPWPGRPGFRVRHRGIVAVLFLGGIQLLSLGIIGEYLARVYTEVKQRPLYLIRRLHGVEGCAEGFGARRP